MKENQPSPLAQAINGFANTLAALAALFLLPFFAQHFRVSVDDYLQTAMNYSWAYWGSWLFVVLAAGCCYFGVSTLLQLLVHGLIRSASRRRGSF